MIKRESGWYRTWVVDSEFPKLSRYFAHDFTWIEQSQYDGSVIEVNDDFYAKIDSEMVMTPSGELVCHQPTDRALAAVERHKNPETWNVNEHDPVYNTQQEG